MASANDFFENLSKTFTKTADKVAKRTDEFISVQKVKSKKNSLENQMNSTYREIGKIVFAEYAKGNPLSEDLAKLCEKIKKYQKEIDICKSEIADIKGVKVCDSCGSPIPEEADYCMKCGNPKPADDDVEDAEFENAADPDDEPEEDEEISDEE